MRVVVPTHLQRYTARVAEVDAEGATLAEVLVDLDRRYPGIRFRVVDEQDRIRPHIKFFVGEELAHTLAVPIDGRDVLIVAAFSAR
jgi:molybdopterin synthase sulfur carrier subunit